MVRGADIPVSQLCLLAQTAISDLPAASAPASPGSLTLPVFCQVMAQQPFFLQVLATIQSTIQRKTRSEKDWAQHRQRLQQSQSGVMQDIDLRLKRKKAGKKAAVTSRTGAAAAGSVNRHSRKGSIAVHSRAAERVMRQSCTLPAESQLAGLREELARMEEEDKRVDATAATSASHAEEADSSELSARSEAAAGGTPGGSRHVRIRSIMKKPGSRPSFSRAPADGQRHSFTSHTSGSGSDDGEPGSLSRRKGSSEDETAVRDLHRRTRSSVDATHPSSRLKARKPSVEAHPASRATHHSDGEDRDRAESEDRRERDGPIARQLSGGEDRAALQTEAEQQSSPGSAALRLRQRERQPSSLTPSFSPLAVSAQPALPDFSSSSSSQPASEPDSSFLPHVPLASSSFSTTNEAQQPHSGQRTAVVSISTRPSIARVTSGERSPGSPSSPSPATRSIAPSLLHSSQTLPPSPEGAQRVADSMRKRGSVQRASVVDRVQEEAQSTSPSAHMRPSLVRKERAREASVSRYEEEAVRGSLTRERGSLPERSPLASDAYYRQLMTDGSAGQQRAASFSQSAAAQAPSSPLPEHQRAARRRPSQPQSGSISYSSLQHVSTYPVHAYGGPHSRQQSVVAYSPVLHPAMQPMGYMVAGAEIPLSFRPSFSGLGMAAAGFSPAKTPLQPYALMPQQQPLMMQLGPYE